MSKTLEKYSQEVQKSAIPRVSISSQILDRNDGEIVKPLIPTTIWRCVDLSRFNGYSLFPKNIAFRSVILSFLICVNLKSNFEDLCLCLLYDQLSEVPNIATIIKDKDGSILLFKKHPIQEAKNIRKTLYWYWTQRELASVNKAQPDTLRFVILVEDIEEKCQPTSTLRSDDKLAQDLKRLFLDGEDIDTYLYVKTRRFRAHKHILGARCPVLGSLIREKSYSTFVDIPDCDPDSFQDFLLYLYSGTVENISRSNVLGLCMTAKKFDTEELNVKCLEFMIKTIDLDNFCDFHAFAAKHSHAELLKACEEFFTNNIKQKLEPIGK